MNQIKTTYAPWLITRNGRTIKSIGPCESDQYAGSSWLELSDADANLISAAPELLDALREVVWVLSKEAPGTSLNNHRFDALGIKCHAAIAKAEGRS